MKKGEENKEILLQKEEALERAHLQVRELKQK
jgi:hypothetical protein